MMTLDDPIAAANNFVAEANAEGFPFDFSLRSLALDVDNYLEKCSLLSEETKRRAECDLTAYIGETIRRLYGGNGQENMPDVHHPVVP